MTPDQIARVCHEANKAVQIIQKDPTPSPSWDQAPDWQRKSAIEGVTKAIEGYGPEELHQSWLDFKSADGWVLGPVKSETFKTHPAMLPYEDLPDSQKIKDNLFYAIVNALV